MGVEKDEVAVDGVNGSDASAREFAEGGAAADQQAFYHSHDVFGGEEDHDVG